MDKKALNGVRVLEYAQLVAGPYCGKLLADLGAEVIKVEEANIGDPARRMGPFFHDIPDPECSGLFLYLNTNKLGISLNLRTPDGADSFKRLATDADILIADQSPQMMKELGLSFEILEAINPRLVVTAITPFGQTGPYSEFKAYPLNIAHSGLLGYLTPVGSRFLDREPLKLGGTLNECSCGLVAAVGTLAALFAQRASGLGQMLDLSKQEAMLDLARIYAARYPNSGVTLSRKQLQIPPLIACKNGYVVLTLHETHHWQAAVSLMGNPEWAKNKLYDTFLERVNRLSEIKTRMEEWARDYTKEELSQKGQEANCPITPVMSAEDLANSEQYKARDFFVEVEHSMGQKVKCPGAPYKFSRTPWKIDRPAPSLGQHNKLVLHSQKAHRWKDSRRTRDVRPKQVKERPLEGIRVADFTWAWAGPFAVGLLAKLGAEVIKIESSARLDHSRIESFSTGQVFEGTDRSPIFNDLNVNKMGITLNLAHPKGIELAKRVVKISDVAVQNMRPGVMDRLGLGYEALRSINPEVIMLSLSALGMTGPQRHYIGYAPAFAAMGGLSYITGYPDDSPTVLMGEVDLLSGTTAAFAILAALIHKQQTGKGQHVDLSCTEAISVLIADVLMDYTMNGRVQSRKGNEDGCMAPHNCYQCMGDDKWISIAIGTDEEWKSFCQVVGHSEWIRDPRFADAVSRGKNRKEIDALVTSWTLNKHKYEAMEILQKAGIAAIPSFDGEDLYKDPHLKERKCWLEVEHPLIGKRTVVAPPWKLSRTPAQINHRGPFLGEHNEYVFGQLLGLSRSEIENLILEKVIY